MAVRLGLLGPDRRRHVIANPAWDDGPPSGELARQADRPVGGAEACLVNDDMASVPRVSSSLWALPIVSRMTGAPVVEI
jgi:hypothetical protein